MRIFQTRVFLRFAAKEAIGAGALRRAIGDLASGKFDASLGGGLFKQRLARAGQGKSGGYRLMIAFDQKARAIFLLGFAKSRMSNASQSDVEALKEFSKFALSCGEDQIRVLLAKGALQELGDE
jgi:hypothetical protein